MPMVHRRIPVAFAVLWAASVSLFPSALNAASATRIQFNRDIRPLLSDRCFTCHGPDVNKRKAKLRLDLREEAVKKSQDGTQVIVPRKPDASELMKRLTTADEDDRMPPVEGGKSLKPAEIALIKRWIQEGASYESHWAFQSPVRPSLPKVKRKSWARNEIDLFVLQRLEAEGLAPSPEADRRTWLRRVSLDLVGLPPTPAEVAAFLQDKSSQAFEKVVDRLLNSPRYGEHMARHWLDAARYADTNGYNNDADRIMWPWRDWVIEAFNANLPYDQFIRHQLAGDLMPQASRPQKVASGFNRTGVFNTEGGIIEEEYRVEYVADRVQTTATVFLGLTLQCARCHDHKYDPVTQKDYYRFFGYFNNIPDTPLHHTSGKPAEPYLTLATPEQEQQLKQWDVSIQELKQKWNQRQGEGAAALTEWEAALSAEAKGKIPAPAGEVLKVPATSRTAEQQAQLKNYFFGETDAEGKKLKQQLTQAEQARKKLEDSIPTTLIAGEHQPPRATYLLKRGAYDGRAETVEPGVPSNLPKLKEGLPGNRLGLADWLTHPQHPLTARVAVNRWWEMYFGTGLVQTTEDFGFQGSYPSHPELLDWLAVTLVDSGWNVKDLQRAIVLSATYRQSSDVPARLLEKDPANTLLARGPRFRLPAEVVRDSALAVSGLLKEKLGGPSVKPYQPPGLWEEVSVERRYTYIPDKGEGLYRRSLYTFWKRTCPPPALMTFDAPDRETCVVKRARTSTPLQALILLNDPTYVEAARKLAERVLLTTKKNEEILNEIFHLVLGRPVEKGEQKALLQLHREALTHFQKDPEAAGKLLKVGDSAVEATLDAGQLAAWTAVASTVLNLDETITKN